MKQFEQCSGKNDEQQDCQPDKPFLRRHRIVENRIAFAEFPPVLFRFRDNREGQQDNRGCEKDWRRADFAVFCEKVGGDCNQSENDGDDSRNCRMTKPQTSREKPQLQQNGRQKEPEVPVRDDGEKRHGKEGGVHSVFYCLCGLCVRVQGDLGRRRARRFIAGGGGGKGSG